MAGNTFGESFRLTTFGESHGEALGCVIDGCPAGLDIDAGFLQAELDRRRPGQGGAAVTSRKEGDKAEILSGVFDGKATGTPIAIIIRNSSQRSGDYDNIKDKFRPGHADYTYFRKYGIRDYRGGGRSSGRETAARVAAGAVAKMLLSKYGIQIKAYTIKAAGIDCGERDLSAIEKNPLRACSLEAAARMQEEIEKLRKEGNSAGGIVECRAVGLAAGFGEPVFDKLDAVLAHAIVSIGAVKGIEFGSGFAASDMTGRENNDSIRKGPSFQTNNAGGILGGISNGDELVFRAAVKPVPSIYIQQQTVDISGNECDILIEGRHDVCLCPRIVPVVEAMTAITLADALLRNRGARL
ncbi:MAG: chorismate synthase [Treponema sp.]|nr:chorismate synthase [Treponema sp.]